MVSWTGPLSGPDGSVSGYNPLPVPGKAAEDVFHLGPGGSPANTNFTTRLGYKSSPALGGASDNLIVKANFSFVAGDFTVARPRGGLTVVVVPTSAFSGVPTNSQILNSSAAKFYRAPNPRTGAGAFTGVVSIPCTSLAQNTRYWVLAYPARYTTGPSTPSNTNDLGIAGGVNSNGRSLGFWTNRYPAKPTIISPTTGTSVSGGSSVEIIWLDGDPDSGGLGTPDVAGAVVQARPAPTSSNPNPAWVYLDTRLTSSTLYPSWMILNSSANFGGGTHPMVQVGKLTIYGGDVDLGSSPSYNYAARLGFGDWDIRVRTFDFGFPDGRYPVGKTTKPTNYSPLNYPAVNQSPWSDSIRISVPAVCPPPRLLAPIRNVAIPKSTFVTFSWQYINTNVPPFTQDKRTVRYRKVGDTAWITAINDSSSSQSFTLASALDEGFQYEWQVNVTDSATPTAHVSGWSDSGTFWVVPDPVSGNTIVPSSTVSGATLGCGTHRVFLYERGGKRRIGEIRGTSKVEWGRTRDDISTASIQIQDWDIDRGNLLSTIEPWAHELVVYRDNGYSIDRVWEGPVTLCTYETDKVTVDSKDVIGYLYRRIIKLGYNDISAGFSVVARVTQLIQDGFAPDDPNVLAYLNPITNPGDATEHRAVPDWSRSVFEEIDDLAANAGVDYTAIGRSICVWDTSNPIGQLPELRDENFGSAPIVSVYGMGYANVYAVTDGNGVYGVATSLDPLDTPHGRVEMLATSWSSSTGPASGSMLTSDDLAKTQAAFTAQASRGLQDRTPVPVVVRIPDNTTLTPDTPLSIQQLVPGVAIPLRSISTLREVLQMQKLDSIQVTEEAGKETVSITLSPFNHIATDDSGTVLG